MDAVININQYNKLLYEAGKNGANIKNCYMLPSEVEYHISRSSLYYEVCDGGVGFFCDKSLYYRLYFCFESDVEITLPSSGKPLVTELIATNPSAIENAGRFLESLGFALNNQASRMYMTISVQEIRKLKKNNTELKISLISPDINIADDIYSLWLNTFDPVKNLLPSKKELAEDIAAGNIIAAVSDGILCGALKLEFTKSTGYIWHEAVSQDFRGYGVGSMLTAFYLEKAAEKDIFRHYLWVEDGSPAVMFHKKFNYQFDGRISRQYIKN